MAPSERPAAPSAEALRHQQLLRLVNERIRRINDDLGILTGVAEILCECGRVECTTRLTIPLDEYRHARDDGRVFIVAPGHDQADLVRVARACGDYLLVTLRPAARRLLARDAD